jgi:hypothetical protein
LHFEAFGCLAISWSAQRICSSPLSTWSSIKTDQLPAVRVSHHAHDIWGFTEASVVVDQTPAAHSRAPVTDKKQTSSKIMMPRFVG